MLIKLTSSTLLDMCMCMHAWTNKLLLFCACSFDLSEHVDNQIKKYVYML